jgi:hypothetical protein
MYRRGYLTIRLRPQWVDLTLTVGAMTFTVSTSRQSARAANASLRPSPNRRDPLGEEIEMNRLVGIKRRMLAMTMTAAAAASLTLAAASPAAAAPTPSCSTMGAYVNPVAPSGSWNSYFHHKVICNVRVIVDVYLYRNGTNVAWYRSSNNAPVDLRWRNQDARSWPIFCGSRYKVAVGVMNEAGGSSAIWYWTPDVVRC